ncbi:MAG TPA: anhydro-N-acetylmuramic acid kinase [Verrucomicrobiae bacterium]|jgi:anhydro-N-acetylmuramic acid kinase|nr:anhydro-N-acetylmuramic acid kinase [Verrucomicrobiae bacterium]
MGKLALGLMSGTSADGVSVAAGSFGGDFKIYGYETYDFPPALALQIKRARSLKIDEFSRLNVSLGKFFGRCALSFITKNKLSRSRIAVIGSHGQTLYHGPADNPPNTLQAGEPSEIAEITGLPVVADFRPRDIAAGGEGAPLIPFFDQFFFGKGRPRALQNIGGIGNVSLVGKPVRPLAFDTGPGNCLMDLAAARFSRGKSSCDRNGILASRGKVDFKAVNEMMRHPFFRRKPPKSTGLELFNERFVPARLWRQEREDCLATLTYFTAHAIRQSYEAFLPRGVAEVIVSGGGAFNKTLMKFLRQLLAPVPVRSIADYGMHPQAKEPLAFAFFAWEAIHGRINHFPAGTGAQKTRVLGKIIPGGRGASH